jgi:hypothetical protein
LAGTLFRSHTNNMQTRQLTAEILDAAIEGFEARKARIDEQIAQLRQLLNGDQPVAAGRSEPQNEPRRKMSAATRQRMGEAQRKRWAATKSDGETASKATAKPKRKLSAAGRAAIVAALKRRWAAKKAGLVVVKKTVAEKGTPKKAFAKKAAAKTSAAA